MEFQPITTVSLHCSPHPSFPHLPSSHTFTTAISRRRLLLYGGGKYSTLHPYRFSDRSISKSRIRALSAAFDPNEFEKTHESVVSLEGILQTGETTYCSVKKAFTSTVFIILELHSFALQMREFLYNEDLQGILEVVQKEVHASFVWLFQKVYSHTPILMVYVMDFLANYSVYSMSTGVVAAALAPVQVQQVSTMEDHKGVPYQRMESSSKVALSSSSDKTISIGGGGGGGKYRPLASDTKGDDRFSESNHFLTIVPNESSLGSHQEEPSSFSVEESRDGAAEHEAMKGLVSSANIKIESRDYLEQFRTEMQYLMELAQEPNNSLLLANFAQFLYLVAKDFDRAEAYFERATKIEPKDAEALNKYAHFLWEVKNDLWAAEETFLEAIDIEPQNPFYPAEYAHFLWTTGGEDTCFPLA